MNRRTPKYDLSDAPPWALQAAAQRKKLTVAEKADITQRLQRELGWTGLKVAQLFGVSGSAVYLWLESADPQRAARRREQQKFYREQTQYERDRVMRAIDETRRHGSSTARAVLWRAQDGLCYLCQRPLGPDRKGVIDHDHRCCPNLKSCPTCRRGLACSPCNRIIGLANDDPERLELIARNLRVALETVTSKLAPHQVP